jgi:HAE1 family hydrophobic/amphiphilic exporter-1
MWLVTKWALRSRVVTILLALIVSGVSVWGFLGLKTELIPDINFPYTTVVTVYPQATPDTVADEITSPIEKVVWDEWSGKGLKHVTSTSSAGMSVIMAEFEYGTNMTAVGESLNESIGKLTLPQAVIDFPKMMGSDVKNPQIIPINMNIMPLINLSLSGDLPPEQLKQIAIAQIVPELSGIEGVLRVDVEGGEKDQIVVSPDPEKMNQYGISMAQIAGLIGTDYSSLSEVENTSLGTDGVILSNVATVNQSPPPLSAITRTNGHPSVGIAITKTDSANTVETADAVNAKIAELQGKLGDGVTVNTIFDQSDFINANISQLEEKAVIGGVLAILVVFFFLWAVRASLITAISIPLSIFIGFLCMRFTGITLNILTLSAMAIAVGRLIDDSIVMVEVIYRRMKRGENFKEAAIEGAKEIATPITSATLATVAIFIPLMFVGGIIGEMFIPFALTVTFAMLASLVVALMLIPALSRWLIGSSKKKTITPVQDNWYQRVYVRALKWVLGHRIIVIVDAVILLIGSVGLLAITGTSFMSGEMGEPTISISIDLPANTEINATSLVVTEVENILSENPAVRSYISTIGTSTSLSGIMSAAAGGGSNTAKITVYLKSDANVEQETAIISEACWHIKPIGAVAVSSGSGIDMGFAMSNLSLSVKGENQEDIAGVAAQLMEKLQGLNGIQNLKSDLTTVVSKLNIAIDSNKVASSGLPVEQMSQLQQEFMLLMNGSTLPGKTVSLDGSSYSIYVDGVAKSLSDVAEAINLNIGFPQSVTLGSIADVTILEQPSHISHTDTKLSATITGTITDKDVGSINMAVQKEIDALPEHPGVEVVAAGISEMMTDTFSKMFIAIIVAVVIVLLIVILMMRSLINPLIIMVSIPLAFIGSILALLASNYTLGISAMMGLLMLVGIVLTNAIVLVSIVEEHRRKGTAVNDALIEGGKTRIRPILMTALTTILAMIPMAVITNSGTMISTELAIVVIGGMFSSTLLTLFVIPAIYSLVYQRRKKNLT